MKKKTEETGPYSKSTATILFKRKVDKAVSEPGVTQSDIAAKLGVVSHYVGMMKNGKVKISITKAAEIAKAFDIDPTLFTVLVIEQHYPEIGRISEATKKMDDVVTPDELILLNELRDSGLVRSEIPRSLSEKLSHVVSDYYS